MPFDFENMEINSNIRTHETFRVSKMPDIFLEVEFTYPRTPIWTTYIPIFEKYQGINFTESPTEDVVDYIVECYNNMAPSNASIWNSEENQYWNEHQRANKAKPLFDVINRENQYHLTQWLCRQCTDTSQVNSQAASRIRALKQTHGYHIATKDFNCAVCGEITTHDFLMRIPRMAGNSNRRYTLSNSLRRRIKRLFNYTDACYDEQFSEDSRNLTIDHKFPSTRWAAGENPNFASMSDEDIRGKFQLLTQQTNLQKERFCSKCLNEGIRGNFFGIKWYSEGDENWRGANNSDELGCLGCPWYDFEAWKQSFNEYLANREQ